MATRTGHSSTFTRAMVVPVLMSLALTGCGSTALRGGAQAAGGNGLSATDSTGGGLQTPGGAAGSSTGLPGPSSSTSGTSGLAGTSGTSGSSGGATGGATAGFTAGGSTGVVNAKKPIKLGVVATDLAAIATMFGKSNVDVFATPKAIIAYLNKHGGIGGRQISAVYYKGDSAADNSTNGQAACQAFTQDNHVDIVASVGLLGDVLPACLRQKGIAMIDFQFWSADNVAMKQDPNWILPSAMNVDRQIQALLQISAARSVLKKGDNLGVMVEECPWGTRTYNNVVVPMAKQLGVKLTYGSVHCDTNLVQDIGPIANDVQRDALTFSSSGVTHVMAVSVAEAFLIATFTTNASQQKYFPKYLVTSNAYPWGNSQSDATVKISKDALPNMSGAGYLPLLDVGTLAKPATPAQQASQTLCTKADPTQLGAATETDSGKSYKKNTFYGVCEVFLLLKATLEADGMRFGYPDVVRGFASLKQRGETSSCLTKGRFAGPLNLIDGAGFMQPFAYDTTRKTFHYVGDPFSVP